MCGLVSFDNNTLYIEMQLCPESVSRSASDVKDQDRQLQSIFEKSITISFVSSKFSSKPKMILKRLVNKVPKKTLNGGFGTVGPLVMESRLEIKAS